MKDLKKQIFENLKIAISCLLAFQICFFTRGLSAENSVLKDKSDVRGCEGAWYRIKRKRVPIYQEASSRARVIAYLSRGEKVCYIGEKERFSILDWNAGKEVNQSEPAELVFVRTSDIWSPNSGRPQGFFGRIKQYWHYFRSGGVPEDGLAPYGPLIEIFQKSDKAEHQSSSDSGNREDK